MLILTYIGEKTEHKIEYNKLSKSVIHIRGNIPAKTKGFTLSREGKKDDWDYSAYTTVYRQLEGAIQFSNDGSVYVPPKPIPEPEPYIPTLTEVQEMKVEEMNTAQQAAIQQGVDVQLTDGSTEHFTLTDHDQTSLMGLQTQVAAGAQQIPWHTSDEAEHCKFYHNADMALITTAAMACVTWHVTYFRDLRIYIRSLQTAEEVEAVTYGMGIPEEYQSDVLKALIAQRAQGEVAE